MSISAHRVLSITIHYYGTNISAKLSISPSSFNLKKPNISYAALSTPKSFDKYGIRSTGFTFYAPKYSIYCKIQCPWSIIPWAP